MPNSLLGLMAQGYDPAAKEAQFNALQMQRNQLAQHPQDVAWQRQVRQMAMQEFQDRQATKGFTKAKETTDYLLKMMPFTNYKNHDQIKNFLEANGFPKDGIPPASYFKDEEGYNVWKESMHQALSGKKDEPTLIPKGTMGTMKGGKISPLPPELKQPEELDEVQTLSLPDTDPRKMAYISGKKQIQQAGGQTEAQILAEGGSKAETYIKNKNRLKATEPYFEALGIVTDPDTGKTEVIGYDRRTFKQRREPVPGMPVKPGTIKSVNPVQQAIADAIKESQEKTTPSPKSKAPGGKEKLIHYEVGQDEFFIPESKASKFEIEHPTAKRLSK